MTTPDFIPPGYPTLALFAKVPLEALGAWREEAHDDDFGGQLVDDFEAVRGTGDYNALVTYAPQSSDYMEEAEELAEALSRTCDGVVYAVYFGDGIPLVIGYKKGKKVLDHGPDDAQPYTIAKDCGLGHLSPAD